MDMVLAEYPEITQNRTTIPTNSPSLAAELINEDPVLGRQFLKSIIDWSYEMRKKRPETFSGLRGFLDYRSIDVADE
jgi:hypothetical protein